MILPSPVPEEGIGAVRPRDIEPRLAGGPYGRFEENTLLSSNGYGVARAEDPATVWESLREIGFTGFGTAIYGVDAEHD